MDNNELYKKLKEKAEYKLKQKIESYRRGLGNEFSLEVQVTGEKTCYDVLRKVEEAIFEKYKERYVKDEIEAFMKSVKIFSDNVEYLKQTVIPQE